MFKINILPKFLFLLFFALSLHSSVKNSSDIEILQPSNKTIFEKDSATIVIKIINKDIDKLKILTNTGDIHEIDIKPNRDTYCKQIKLDYGENTIFVRAYSNGKKIYQSPMELFYKFEVYKKYKYASPDFTKNYFHTTKNERLCTKCHKMNSNEKKGIAFENPKESNCYNCHIGMMKYKNAHAPAVNWVCSACHGKDSSPFTKYPSPAKINKSCLKCHKKFRKEFNSSKFKHDPVVSGRCNRCHDSHSSPHKYFVKLAVNDMCTSCHVTKSHIVIEDNELCAASSKGTCTKCHNPHYSNKANFYEPGRQEKKKKEKKKVLWVDEE